MSNQENSLLQEALDHLRDGGLRITQQRTVILKYLIEKRNHPTAEMIFTDIKAECDGMSLAHRLQYAGIVCEEKPRN